MATELNNFIKELNAQAEVYERLPMPSDTAKLLRKAAKGLEDLSKDKARLDWMHHKGNLEIECIGTFRGSQYFIDRGRGKTLRQAIDAAMEGN